MAQGKKSFIAYSDWGGTFKALPDDIAGKLIKYIFSYVNDENPEPHEDFIVNALFEQIKATLKRDLDKWESQREQRSKAGKKSAERRRTKSNERSTSVDENVRKATVNVNDNVNEIIDKSITNKKIDNSEFAKLCLKDTQWLEITCMQTLQDQQQTKNNLIAFNKHLIRISKQYNSLVDYKIHYSNWGRKQNFKKRVKIENPYKGNIKLK